MFGRLSILTVVRSNRSREPQPHLAYGDAYDILVNSISTSTTGRRPILWRSRLLLLQGSARHSFPGPGSIVSHAETDFSVSEEAELHAGELDLLLLRIDCGVGAFGGAGIGAGILCLSVLEMKPLMVDAIQICEARFCCGSRNHSFADSHCYHWVDGVSSEDGLKCAGDGA